MKPNPESEHEPFTEEREFDEKRRTIFMREVFFQFPQLTDAQRTSITAYIKEEPGEWDQFDNNDMRLDLQKKYAQRHRVATCFCYVF